MAVNGQNCPFRYNVKNEEIYMNPKETEQIRHYRRTLHQIPEIRLETPQTAAAVKEFLKPAGLEMIDIPEAGSSFAAWLDLGKEETMAFRSDMDALPVFEKTGLPFASKHEGCMHACGHDGHMSALIAFANRLPEIKDDLDCNILLVFQTGEESPGGAEKIVDTGLFEKYNVKEVYGMHLWPALEKGQVALRPNEMMARCSEVDVTFTGKSAHAAKYKEGLDAMKAAARFLNEASAMEQSLDPEIFRLLHFGRMEAGTVRNAVAAHAVLEGTVRAFQDEVFDGLVEGMNQIAETIKNEDGVDVQVVLSSGYPAVLNNERLCQIITENMEDIQVLDLPEMISEDFSFYQKHAPGVFFFLGTGTGIPLHADTFDFDENILVKAADLYERLARKGISPKTE